MGKIIDLEALRIDPTDPKLVARGAKAKTGYFVRVPMAWLERLGSSDDMAAGKTWTLALHLLFLHWRNSGSDIALSNKKAGISRQSKWRALDDLERRGLITVERRPKRSPLVRVHTT